MLPPPVPSCAAALLLNVPHSGGLDVEGGGDYANDAEDAGHIARLSRFSSNGKDVKTKV